MMSKEVCIDIAGKSFTQDQAASIAFNAYYFSGRNIEAGLITWKKITLDYDSTEKDLAFLVVYFLERLATDEVKEIFKNDMTHIRRYMK